ncbi:MAG: glycosyltransferase family 39 protein [Phycisphaerae bacterium]
MPNPSSTGKLIDRWTIPVCIGVGVFLLRALWYGADPDPPLYYILENIAVRLFGIGPVGLRGLSIICFLAGLIAIRAAAENWFDRRTGIVTLLLCALHPAHLFFGFAARWYSLMFLAVALLLWASARLWDGSQTSRVHILAWAAAAVAACYTNYFGPVVVALVWLAAVWKDRRSTGAVRRWLIAALGAAILYVPWYEPLWREMRRFPSADGPWLSHTATAARTAVALLTGNLATLGAWWVWIPVAGFSVALCMLIRMQWRRIGPPAFIVLGCFAAGVASRTMIDKYVMTFSGPACMLVAAIVVGRSRAISVQSSDGHRRAQVRVERIWRRILMGGLIAGWAGCGVNLVTESHWSSLRWLDPFEAAIAELLDTGAASPDVACVMTHPSARYYYARLLPASLREGEAASSAPDPETWRRFAMPPTEAFGPSRMGAETPESVLIRMRSGRPPLIVTMETTGFVDRFDWDALYDVLAEEYRSVGEPRLYLEDPDAAWKDRLDPKVEHPSWRIVVRRWQLRE